MPARPPLAALAREALLTLATILIGAVLVSGLIFLPLLLGRDGRPTAETLAAYLATAGDYLAGLARGDLGVTARGRPATGEVLEAARRTVELLIASALVALPLGLGWGALLASVRRGPLAVLLLALSSALIALPSFTAMLLLGELVAGITARTGVRLAYIQGYGLDQHLILPVTVLALRGAASLARAVQVAQEEVLAQDYIRAARARGIDGLRLWRGHVLPALRLPLIGGALGMVRVLLGGMVIVDYLFGWGGLGRKLLQINSGGVIAAGNSGVAAGSAIMLLLIIVVVDGLGRALLRDGARPAGGQ